MKNVFVVDHPLVNHKMAKIRDKNTGSKDFRETVSEIGALITYEVTRDLETKTIEIETPITKCKAKVLAKDIVIVPILRAGLGMVDGIHNIIPTAKIGHIGLYRDEETFMPHQYYAKFPPNAKDSIVILVDPMVGTGGSVIAAMDILKNHGITNIVFVGLVASPEGIAKIRTVLPDLKIYVAAIDEKLNDKAYIVPGLGDCGDRLFGTK